MQGKSVIFEGKTEFGQGWTDQERPGTGRPGGTRGGCMIRFARNQTLYLYQNLICAFNTALARKGLAVFQALRAFRRARRPQRRTRSAPNVINVFFKK